MPWYAAHAIHYFEQKAVKRQATFVVWESVYLIRAPNPNGARKQATRVAKAAEGDDGGTLELNGRPVTLRLAGIRKIIEVAPGGGRRQPVERLATGDEASYSRLVVRGVANLKKLAAGEPVRVSYDE